MQNNPPLHTFRDHKKPKRAYNTAATGRGGARDHLYSRANTWEGLSAARGRSNSEILDPETRAERLLWSLEARYQSLFEANGVKMRVRDTRDKVHALTKMIASIPPTNTRKEYLSEELIFLTSKFSQQGHTITKI